MPETHQLTLQPGLIVDQEFFDYPDMQESAKNWLFTARYRFGSGNFYGRHDGIQLNNLQFGHADRHEGMFFQGISPKDCLTIAVVQKNSAKLCINELIMEVGDVVVIDDLKPYDFSSSQHTKLAIVSIRKSLLMTTAPLLLNSTDKKFKDKENILSNTIENEWKHILKSPQHYQSKNEVEELEEKILNAIKNALKGQTGKASQLTQGEKMALKVKSFLLESLNENISIKSLTRKFNISEKTLENSFHSLYGIAPKRFITLLKLNHAHEDLLRLDLEATKVSDIAIKWGFSHFGRFSKKYKSIFGVLPLETLKREHCPTTLNT